MRTRMVAPALGVIALLAACGSGGGKETTSTTASVPAASVSTVKATGGGAFCTKMADAINNGTSKVGQAFQPGRTPDQIKGLLDQIRKAEQDALSRAPSEIKADLRVLVDESSKIFDALAAANYDPSKVDPAALTSADTPPVRSASQHVTAYVKAHCGIDLSGPATTAP